jgi:biotin carboxyl carrier protein
MRKFNVTVNGVAYDVEIEEVEAGTEVAAPVSKAAAPKASAPKAAPKAAAPAGAVAVKAPMPGTILKVNVTAGQSVKKGDIVAILEAMKMENEIFAPADGTVASVNVNKGSAVKAEDIIITLN